MLDVALIVQSRRAHGRDLLGPELGASSHTLGMRSRRPSVGLLRGRVSRHGAIMRREPQATGLARSPGARVEDAADPRRSPRTRSRSGRRVGPSRCGSVDRSCPFHRPGYRIPRQARTTDTGSARTFGSNTSSKLISQDRMKERILEGFSQRLKEIRQGPRGGRAPVQRV